VTFSVLCRADELIGGAAASHSVAVGARVLWARPRIGIVATQAITRQEYGPELLTRMAVGQEFERALARGLHADRHSDMRQVAVMHVSGRHAQHSGSRCLDVVEEAASSDACAQGNMLTVEGTCAAMVAAARSPGELARRLIAALKSGEQHGGDQRQTRSASMLIVDRTRVLVDLRVDDNVDPIAELTRLYGESLLQADIASAQQNLMGRGGNRDLLITALNRRSSTAAVREADRLMWLGLLKTESGDTKGGLDALRSAIAMRPRAALTLSRVLAKGGVTPATATHIREAVGHE
jgi:uncharacterized Ntn-hydrolase superfamily protein